MVTVITRPAGTRKDGRRWTCHVVGTRGVILFSVAQSVRDVGIRGWAHTEEASTRRGRVLHGGGGGGGAANVTRREVGSRATHSRGEGGRGVRATASAAEQPASEWARESRSGGRVEKGWEGRS